MKASCGVSVSNARGTVSFDSYRNVVRDVFIRRVEGKYGHLVNVVERLYDKASQFWTYKPVEFSKNPAYSRDYPPARNLET